MPKQNVLPRYWKKKIGQLTGLNYCDRDCGCGENNQLWWFPVTANALRSIPPWVPGWMNGADTYDVWEWLVENGKV